MSFDSIFRGDPRNTNVNASGTAENGIDIISGQTYYKAPGAPRPGWIPTAGSGGGGTSAAQTITALANTGGPGVTAGQAISMSQDGSVFPAGLNFAQFPVIGIALNSGADGESITVQTDDVATVLTDGSANPGQAIQQSTDGTGALCTVFSNFTITTAPAFIVGIVLTVPDDAGTVTALIKPFFVLQSAPN